MARVFVRLREEHPEGVYRAHGDAFYADRDTVMPERDVTDAMRGDAWLVISEPAPLVNGEAPKVAPAPARSRGRRGATEGSAE